MSIDVFYESTPNPQSMKFVYTQQIANESAQFQSQADAARSPLAQKLFGFPWAKEVFVGPYFVTITKQEWVDWEMIADPLANLLKEHIENEEPVFIELQTASPAESSTHDISDDDSPMVQKIRHVLNTEVRPAVAMDGGDIVFQDYKDGVVYLNMLGACSGCPSSTMTLKQGVESRLRAVVPEIKEVVQVL